MPQLTQRGVLRIAGAAGVLLVAAILMGVLIPKAAKDKKAASGSAVKATTTGTPYTQPIYNDEYPYNPSKTVTTKPPTAAATTPTASGAKVPTATSGRVPTTNADKAAEDMTDDPDDDFTDDDGSGTSKLPNVAHPQYNSIVSWGWAAIGKSPSTICYATTGKELRHQAEGTTCTVIILTRGSQKPYTLAKTVKVKGKKIILGHPIDLPIVNAYDHHIERAFEVMPGALLDIRFVQIIRGYGRRFGPEDRGKIIMGGCVMVWPTGTLLATGCIFTIETQTLEQYLYDVEIALNGLFYHVFGGYVLQLGGYAHLLACSMITLRPYGMPYLYNVILGRDFCVLAGIANLMGTVDVTVQAYSMSATAGTIVCVLGGALNWAGGAIVSVLGAQAQYGAGHVLFVGGGAMIITGCPYVTVVGVLHRAGFGSFTVGGGAAIYTGFNIARAWGAVAIHNFGHTLAVGAGAMQMIGCTVASAVHQWFFTGQGGFVAQGAGDFFVLGTPQVRTVLCQANFGLGFFFSNGAGISKLIGSPSASIHLVRALIGLGGEVYSGAGLIINIANARFNAQLINYFLGRGVFYFLGAGAMFLLSGDYSLNRLITFPTPSPEAAAYVVGSKVVTVAEGAKKPYWITNGGVFPAPTPKRERERQLWEKYSPTPTPVKNVAAGQKKRRRLDGTEEPTDDFPIDEAELEEYISNLDTEYATADAVPPVLARPPASAASPTPAKPPVKAPTPPTTTAAPSTKTSASSVTPAPTHAPTTPPTTPTTTGPSAAPSPGAPTVGAPSLFGNITIEQDYPNYVFICNETHREAGTMAEAVANETWDQAMEATEEGDLLGAFPSFEQIRRLTEAMYQERVPVFSTADINGVTPDSCIIADMTPNPSREHLSNGTKCQAIDTNSPPDTTIGRRVQAVSAMASPETPWVDDYVLPYAAAASKDPNDTSLLPTTGLISYDVLVSCAPASGSTQCATDDIVKDALYPLLNKNRTGDYSLSVTAFSIPASYEKHLNDFTGFEVRRHLQNMGSDSLCPTTTTYKVHTTTHFDDLHKELIGNFDNLESDAQQAVLQEKLTHKIKAAGSSAVPCGLAVNKNFVLAVPPIGKAPAYTPANSRNIWPVVSVGDGKTLSPVPSVNKNQSYEIFLYNWAADHDIVVELFVSTSLTPIPITTVKAFKDEGITTVPWDVHDGVTDNPLARCYLKAYDKALEALFVTSQPFLCPTYNNRRRKRRYI